MLNIVKKFYKVKTKSLPEYFQELFPAANPAPKWAKNNPFASSDCGKIWSQETTHQVPSTKHNKQNWSLVTGIMWKIISERFR